MTPPRNRDIVRLDEEIAHRAPIVTGADAPREDA